MQTCYRCSDTLHRCSLAKPKIKIVYTLKRLPLSLCSRFAKNGDSFYRNLFLMKCGATILL